MRNGTPVSGPFGNPAASARVPGVLLVNDGIDRRIDLLRPGDRHFEHRFGAEFAFGD